MRVLFSSVVSYSVFHSQLPLAQALRDLGHDVAFATGREFGAWVRRMGLPTFGVGIDGPAFAQELVKRFPQWPAGIARDEHLRFFLTNECAEFAAPATLADLVPVVEAWAPNLIVHDTSEFAGPIAATLAGIPHVNHAWGLLLPLDLMRAAGEAVAPLWEQRGLEPEPMGGMFTHLYLDIAPPSVQVAEIAQLPTARPLRPVLLHFRIDDAESGPGTGQGDDEELPPWFPELSDQPTVYVALGTLFNATTVFSTILEGLADEPVNVLVNLGPQNDPRDLGAQPSNVRVERYLPQSRLLPHCDLVITHAGPATMLAALSHGLPMLLVPRGSDQFRNAEQCVEAGVGRRLLDAELTPERVGEEVRRLLGDLDWAKRAGSVRAEIDMMPAPHEQVALLEQLAATGRLA